MLVYRIETKTGDGPYGARNDYWSATRDVTMPPGSTVGDLPIPENDAPALPRQDNHICAFVSKEQLLQWFTPKGCEALHKQGFALSVYSVPKEKVLAAKRQCIIPKEVAVKPKTRLALIGLDEA